MVTEKSVASTVSPATLPTSRKALKKELEMVRKKLNDLKLREVERQQEAFGEKEKNKKLRRWSAKEQYSFWERAYMLDFDK